MRGKIFLSAAGLSGVLFLLITALFSVQLDYGTPAERFIPAACLVVMALAAVSELAAARRESGGLFWSGEVLKGLIAFAAYLCLIYLIGFLAATPLFTATVFRLMAERKTRGALSGLVFGCILAAFVYGLFVCVMGNLLPQGTKRPLISVSLDHFTREMLFCLSQ